MVLPHVNEEPLPSFQLDEALDEVPPAPRAVPRFNPESASESHVRARTSSLPPPNPPSPKPTKPAKPTKAAAAPLELPKIETKRATEIPANLAALANAVDTYSFSSESMRSTVPSEIDIDIDIDTEPPNVERNFDAALKAAGWKAAPRDFAAPAVRIDRPFAVLPRLHEMPSTIPPTSGMMQVVSIPPQPVPSLPVAPLDLDAEYAILSSKNKTGGVSRFVWPLFVFLAVLAVPALLMMPDITGDWIESVRAPLRAPLHDLGVDLPRPP